MFRPGPPNWSRVQNVHEIAQIRSQMKAMIIAYLCVPSKRAGNGVRQGAGWLCKLVRDEFRTKQSRNSYPLWGGYELNQTRFVRRA